MRNGFHDVDCNKAIDWICTALTAEDAEAFRALACKGHYESLPSLLNHSMRDGRFVNRRIRERARRKYTRDMQQGKWRGKMPIFFHEDGYLVDGFHRLLSVIASGTTTPFYVITGMTNEDVIHIDGGVSRTAADIASRMHGIQNASRVMAISNLMFRVLYDTEASLTDKLDTYTKYEEAICWAIDITFARKSLLSAQVGAALALTHLVNKRKAIQLGESLASMAGWERNGVEQRMQKAIETTAKQSRGGSNIDLLKKLLRGAQLYVLGAAIFAKLQTGEEGVKWVRNALRIV